MNYNMEYGFINNYTFHLSERIWVCQVVWLWCLFFHQQCLTNQNFDFGFPKDCPASTWLSCPTLQLTSDLLEMANKKRENRRPVIGAIGERK